MIPVNLLKTIEASGYGMRLGLVSTPSRFIEAVSKEPRAQKIAELLDQTDAQEELLVRLKTLLSAENDPRYAHPNDLAIAAYLYLLQKADPNAVLKLAKELVDTPTLWWARAMAIHTINETVRRTRDVNFYIWQEDAWQKEQIATKSLSKTST